jgi:hypothetical protein
LAADAAKVKSVVLVHGGFVDGSGWQRGNDLLKKDAYDVTIVQNPTTSLADDLIVLRRALQIAVSDGTVLEDDTAREISLWSSTGHDNARSKPGLPPPD